MSGEADRKIEMGRSRELIPDDGAAWVRIQYIRCRQVLRLIGVQDDLEPVEIPLPVLLSRLAIDPKGLAAPIRYLLFAGVHGQPRGGTRGLVGAFPDEGEARQAFVALRTQRSDRDGWAELAALDQRGHLTQLAWFGQDGVPASTDRPSQWQSAR